MKKYLFFAAAVAITACTQDTLIDDTKVPETTKDVAIGFGTSFTKQTRAENDKDATKEAGLENYNKSFLVWANKNVKEGTTEKNPSVMFRQLVEWTSTTGSASDWTYAPLRYWDKAAQSYRFFAVSPNDANWTISKATKTDDSNPTAITTMDDIKKVDFKYTGYKADGKSLAQVKQNTTSGIVNDATDQTNDVFTAGKDLMVATDVTAWNKVDGTEKVDLHFNHILSRLNIAVKSGITAQPKPQQIEDGDIPGTFYDIYVYNGTTNLLKEGDKYYEYTVTSDKATKGSQYSVSDPTLLKPTFDQTKSSGIVKLTSVKVFNLNDQGVFDEATDLTTPAITLNEGTDKRWTSSSSNTTSAPLCYGGVTFANSDNATRFTNEPDGATANDYIASTTTDDFTNVLNNEYTFFYQTLVVPQTINYEAFKVDGSEASSTSKPYLQIVFTIDGEPFTYYYNLAGIFSNVYADYVTKVSNVDTKLAKTTTDAYVYVQGTNLFSDASCGNPLTNYAYKNGDSYQDKDGNAIYTDGEKWYSAAPVDGTYDETKVITTPTTFILGTQADPVYVTRAEADKSGGLNDDECDITFCEGWQNNLYIIVNPAHIEFKASVYQWATKESYEFTVQ